MPIDRDLYQREVDLARDRANAGGPASVFNYVITRGAGPFNFAKRIDFGLTFIEEPFMAYGVKIDVDDVLDHGFSPASGFTLPPLPTSQGYVTEWDTDDHGNYVGAWVAVQVSYPTDPGSSADGDPIPMRHYFTFTAVAIKDLADNDDDPPPVGA